MVSQLSGKCAARAIAVHLREVLGEGAFSDVESGEKILALWMGLARTLGAQRRGGHENGGHVRQRKRGVASGSAALPKDACPIMSRFPENCVSKASDFVEVRAICSELSDGAVNEDAMWKLFVFLWVGCGGHQLRSFQALVIMPCASKYTQGDARQPLEILRYIRHQVKECGHMKVFGGDGLDKKSRVTNERWLVTWHENVPALCAAVNGGCAHDLEKALRALPGFGELTIKEFACCVGGTKSSSHVAMASAMVTYGDGAVRGANMLNLKLEAGEFRSGKATSAALRAMSASMARRLGSIMANAFPDLRGEDRNISALDIEVSLSGIVVFSRHCLELQRGKTVESLSVPAGFRPFRDGELENVYNLPELAYERIQIKDRLPRAVASNTMMQPNLPPPRNHFVVLEWLIGCRMFQSI